MSVAAKEFVLTYVVKDVTSLKEGEYQSSPVEEHFGVPWKIGVTRNNRFFSFHLCCDQSKTSEWSIEVIRDLKLISSKGKCRSKVAKSFYDNSHKRTGLEESIDWEEMETDYLVDGNLIVGVHVKILTMSGIKKTKLRNFDESMKHFSDIVLIVNNERFHVSKLFLASQCAYFEVLFLQKLDESERAERSEITLAENNSQDFQNFLELLYGELPIDDETVDGILRLANLYHAKAVYPKCEEFLIDRSEKTLKEKLQMAKRYGLVNLKNACLSQIHTVEDIRSVLLYDYSKMDQTVVAVLLQKSLALHV